MATSRNTLSIQSTDLPDLGAYLIRPYQASGYLSKLSNQGSWQKRYFELRGPYLCYWSNASSVNRCVDGRVSQPSALIDLRMANLTIKWDEEAHQLIIESGGAEAECRLKAPTKKDEVHMAQWLRLLQKAMEGYRSGQLSLQSLPPSPTASPANRSKGREKSSSESPRSGMKRRDSFSMDSKLPSDFDEYLNNDYQARGLLSKLNSKGNWQKRYYELRGPYLCYWATESSKKKDEEGKISLPDFWLDLRLMESIEWDEKMHMMKLTSDEGDEIRLKAPTKKDENHMPAWLKAVRLASKHLQSGQARLQTIAPDHVAPPLPPAAPMVEEIPVEDTKEKIPEILEPLEEKNRNERTFSFTPTPKDNNDERPQKESATAIPANERAVQYEKGVPILQGFLEKKGGGTSVFGRRNWKRRWFILYTDKLKYYESERTAILKPNDPLGEVRFFNGNERESAFSAPLQVIDRVVTDRGIVPTLLLRSKGGRIFEIRACEGDSHTRWESKLEDILGIKNKY